MPIYEFKCQKCGHRCNSGESSAEHYKQKEKGPQCASAEVESLISAVTVKTSKKS